MNVAVVEARGAEHGEGVVIGFAEVEYEWLAAFDAELQMAFEELDLSGLCFGAVMVIEAEFSAGDAFGVGEVFEKSSFVFGGLCFYILGMDAVSGVDEWIFFAEFAGAVKVSRVAGDVDKCFGLCNLGGCRFFFGGAAFGRESGGLETFEKRVKGFARMALVRVDVTMSIDEHDLVDSRK